MARTVNQLRNAALTFEAELDELANTAAGVNSPNADRVRFILNTLHEVKLLVRARLMDALDRVQASGAP